MNLPQQNLSFKEAKTHNSNKLKKEFIKKWIQGLQKYCSSNKQMSLLERTKKIKLSSDIALASARNSTTWSKAIILEVKTGERNTNFFENLSDPGSKKTKVVTSQKRIRSNKILKTSRGAGKREMKMAPRSSFATRVAKRLVKKRTKVLRRLVPGGESMDEYGIIKEAIDYIHSLRVQVDVMKSLVNAHNLG